MRVGTATIKDDVRLELGAKAFGKQFIECQPQYDQSARLLAGEQKLRQQAEEANRLKDDFLALISHELRTPLNAIVGWTTLLRSGKADEQLLAKGLEVIQRNALSQSKMIEELLDISRIVAGKVALDNQLLDMTSVIDDAINSLRPIAEAKQITLFADIDPELGSMIGDPNRLQQIVCNLLSNSVKFTPAGGNIIVTAGRVGSEIELSVRDSGSGIEADFLPHVFERYRQGGTRTTSPGGLGLGLAIVRHLVELHGGSITARSEGLGLGAIFTIRFRLPKNG